MSFLNNKHTIFLAVAVASCFLNSTPAWSSAPVLRHTDFAEAFFGDDHVSEGFLAPLDDGKIMLIFRMDPGIGGDHVGTGGYIAQMTYDPAIDQWGEVQTVYNSNQYDDRNIHGGVTNDGRIVAFFRRYDLINTEGMYFIYSDDNGNSWSDLQTSNTLQGVCGTGQMFYNPSINKYCTMQYDWRTTPRLDILFSDDGSTWNNSNVVREDPTIQLSEVAGAWCGGDRIIALIRDDTRQYGHPLLQVESSDNGQTWSLPRQTSMPLGQHWGSAPQLFYDHDRDLLIALASDRYTRPNSEQSLFIYTAKPDDVFESPDNWTLQYELLRPWARSDFNKDRPLNQVFYGYPTIAPINENEYLVVFTECAVMDGNEQADLYYFKLFFEDPTLPKTIGYWQFNEKAPGQTASASPGSIIDSSGNGHHGTAVGDPLPSYVAGTSDPSSAIALTDNLDRVVVPHSTDFNLMFSSLQSYTIEAIVRFTGEPTDGQAIMTKRSESGGPGWSLRTDGNGRLSLYLQDSSSKPVHTSPDITATVNLYDDAWHHVAVVIEPDSDPTQSSVTFYVDGVEDVKRLINDYIYISGDFVTPWLNQYIGNGSDVWIGDFIGRTSDQFVGEIDAVRFSKGILTPGEFLEPSRPGDANSDGVVDSEDAARLAANWLSSGGWSQGDFNRDGIINDLDAAILAANWSAAGGSSSVPEPGTFALLIGGAAIMVAACRKKRQEPCRAASI